MCVKTCMCHHSPAHAYVRKKYNKDIFGND